MNSFIILETIPFGGRFNKIFDEFDGTVDQAIGKVQRAEILNVEAFGEAKAKQITYEILVLDESNEDGFYYRLERQS
jgi:hypothetical protein